MPQPYCMRSLTLHVLPFFLLLSMAPRVFAADQDTRLRLNQTIEYRANQQERELLKDELPSDGAPPLLNIDGQTYSVGNNLDELGRAVYLSIERQQWPQARDYLRRYTALPGHDPMLTAYAKGGLARAGITCLPPYRCGLAPQSILGMFQKTTKGQAASKVVRHQPPDCQCFICNQLNHFVLIVCGR